MIVSSVRTVQQSRFTNAPQRRLFSSTGWNSLISAKTVVLWRQAGFVSYPGVRASIRRPNFNSLEKKKKCSQPLRYKLQSINCNKMYFLNAIKKKKITFLIWQRFHLQIIHKWYFITFADYLILKKRSKNRYSPSFAISSVADSVHKLF